MFESMNVGIIATDLESRIIEVNDAALKMFGYKREETIGKDGLKFIAGKDQKRLTGDINETFKERHNVNIKYNVTNKSGSTLPVELSATLLDDSNGNPTGFMSILKDYNPLTIYKCISSSIIIYKRHSLFYIFIL